MFRLFLFLCFNSKGQELLGIVESATDDCLWVFLDCNLRGRVFILDVSNEIQDLKQIKGFFLIFAIF